MASDIATPAGASINGVAVLNAKSSISIDVDVGVINQTSTVSAAASAEL